MAAKIAVGNAANLPSSLPTVEGASRLGRAEVEKEAERQELGASRPSGCAARCYDGAGASNSLSKRTIFENLEYFESTTLLSLMFGNFSMLTFRILRTYVYISPVHLCFIFQQHSIHSVIGYHGFP